MKPQVSIPALCNELSATLGGIGLNREVSITLASGYNFLQKVTEALNFEMQELNVMKDTAARQFSHKLPSAKFGTVEVISRNVQRSLRIKPQMTVQSIFNDLAEKAKLPFSQQPGGLWVPRQEFHEFYAEEGLLPQFQGLLTMYMSAEALLLPKAHPRIIQLQPTQADYQHRLETSTLMSGIMGLVEEQKEAEVAV